MKILVKHFKNYFHYFHQTFNFSPIDIINCLNKNSMTHFVWYLQKEKKVWHWNLVHTLLWKNHAENVQEKLVPDLFIILVNNPKQPLHVRNYLKVRYLSEDYQKALKKATSFFLSKAVPFNRQSYQKGPGTSGQSLFRLWNKFKKFSLLVIHYLTKFDGVI